MILKTWFHLKLSCHLVSVTLILLSRFAPLFTKVVDPLADALDMLANGSETGSTTASLLRDIGGSVIIGVPSMWSHDLTTREQGICNGGWYGARKSDTVRACGKNLVWVWLWLAKLCLLDRGASGWWDNLVYGPIVFWNYTAVITIAPFVSVGICAFLLIHMVASIRWVQWSV